MEHLLLSIISSLASKPLCLPLSHKQIDDAIDEQFSVGVSLQLQDRPCWLCLIGQGISIEWLPMLYDV